MKRLLTIMIALCIFCLSACELSVKGVTVEQGNDRTVITFDNFEGKKTVSIPHDSPNEGALYYSTALTDGSLKASYDLGILWDTELLFEVSADSNSIGPGHYIDSSVSKITVCFEAQQPVTGQVILSFSPVEAHEHTGQWQSGETAHWYQYTCGCPSPEMAELHSDIDENKICDICKYVMPGHQHTTAMYKDESCHSFSYTCGCATPPNAAEHSDGNKDGKCDYCEYEMPESTAK